MVKRGINSTSIILSDKKGGEVTRIYTYFCLSFILLFLGAFTGNESSGGVSPPGGAAKFSTPTPLNIEQLKIPEIRIEADYPAQMVTNQSYLIAVSLVPAMGQTPTSSISIEKATTVTSKLTSVGTPGHTLQTAFGDGYKPFATAILNAGSFKVLLVSPDEQALDQPRVEWDWNVTPLFSGTQVVSVNMVVQWKPSNISNSPRQPLPTYSIGNSQLKVEVSEPLAKPAPTPPPAPFIVLGSINIAELLSQILTFALLFGTLGGIFILMIRQVEKKARNKSP